MSLLFCAFHHKLCSSSFGLPLQSTTSQCLRSRGKGERILGDTAFLLAFRITVTVSHFSEYMSKIRYACEYKALIWGPPLPLLGREEDLPSGSANAGSWLPFTGQLQSHWAVTQHQQRQQRLHTRPRRGPGARQATTERQRHWAQPQPNYRSNPLCHGHQSTQPLWVLMLILFADMLFFQWLIMSDQIYLSAFSSTRSNQLAAGEASGSGRLRTSFPLLRRRYWTGTGS